MSSRERIRRYDETTSGRFGQSCSWEFGKHTAVLFCGSGTINIDICLNSLLPEDKRVLIVNNGAYSTRAVEVCQYYGLPHINLEFSVYERPDLSVVENVLQENPDIAMVYTTHHETGTGILNPIREMGAIAHKYQAKFVVDTTSSLGMIPFDIEKDNVDFCMASAQKGLQAMTGLSFIIGNEEQIKFSKNIPSVLTIVIFICSMRILREQVKCILLHRYKLFTPLVRH